MTIRRWLANAGHPASARYALWMPPITVRRHRRISLHAAVRCEADDRQAPEPLCRYIARPALANERVQTNAAGQVVLKLKTPWRDGTTHLVMSPLGFMQRHVDGRLCGIEFCECYVSSGSISGIRRNCSNHRDVSEVNLRWSVLDAPFVAVADLRIPQSHRSQRVECRPTNQRTKRTL